MAVYRESTFSDYADSLKIMDSTEPLIYKINVKYTISDIVLVI